MNISNEIFNRFGKPKSTSNVGRYVQYTFDCPFCQENGKTPDTKGHLSVRSDGLYNCYRCGESGKIHIDGYTTSPELSSILDSVKLYLQNDGVSTNNSNLEDTRYIIPSSPIESDKYALEYMVSRGFSKELLEYYNCRVGSLGTKYFGRVVIPNKLLTPISTDMFVARTYFNDSKRYLNPEGSSASSAVFNLHNIPENPEQIIICEGPLTAMSAGKDAVALYGHYYTNKLSKILDKNPKRIVVNLDPDAVSTSIKLCEVIKSSRNDIDVRLLVLPENKDANDYLRSGKFGEYRKLVDNSPVFDKLLVKILNY